MDHERRRAHERREVADLQTTFVRFENGVRLTVRNGTGASRQGAEAAELLGTLTRRERQLLELMARGLDNGTIAERIGVRPKTVRNHITRIFEKLGVHSRAQAIVMARDAGLGDARKAPVPGTGVPIH